MTALHYIEKRLSSPTEAQRQKAAWRACRKALSAYLGVGKDVDLMEMAVPGWAVTYHEFLIGRYESNKARSITDQAEKAKAREATAREQMAILRMLLRSAQEEGVMPPIDALAEVTQYARRKNVVAPDMSAGLNALIAMGNVKTKAWVDRYLLSLCLGGVDPASFGDTLSTLDPEGRVKLPHLGIKISVSASTKALLIDVASKTVIRQEDIAGVFRGTDTRMMMSGDTVSDWLSIALNKGLIDEPTARRVIAAKYRNKALSDAEAATIANAIDDIANAINAKMSAKSVRRWYVLKAVGQSGESLAKELAALDKEQSGLVIGDGDNIYCPYRAANIVKQPRVMSRRRIAEGDRARTLLRNILFVNTTSDGISLIQSNISGKWIFRHHGVKGDRFSTVTPGEIRAMQLLLNYTSSYSDIVVTVGERHHDLNVDRFKADDEVKLLIPELADYPGVVIKVDRKKSNGDNRHYIVSLTGDTGIRLEMSIPQGLMQRTNG